MAGMGFFRNLEMVSDSVAHSVPTVTKPGYLQPIYDPVFGTIVTRITGDPGTAIPGVSGGVWGQCSRHHYSLDQAWNADQSVLYLENNADPDTMVAGGDSTTNPSGHLFLDGGSYAPLYYQYPPGSGNGDIRWHATDPTLMYYAAGSDFGTWNPKTNATTVLHTFTGYSSLLFGTYKGVHSNDGDFFIFQGKNASNAAVTFAYRVSTGTKFSDITAQANSAQISPLGTYIAIVNSNDDVLVYDRSGNLLQTWTAPSAGSGSPSHADMAIDQAGDEVMVGTGKGGSYGGRIVKRRLSDGTYTALTPASPQNYGQHTSARCTKLPGWAFSSYPDNGAGYPLYGLGIIATKLDGSKVVQVCHNHAINIQSDYYSQPQVSVSPTGDRVIFASNWGDPNGTGRPVQSYVCDMRGYSGILHGTGVG